MNSRKGFTLIELMVTLVIVAILAAIALPSYRSQMIRTRRAAAESCLVELAQFMERSYNVSLSYSKNGTGGALTLPTASKYQCQKDLTDYYTFALTTQTAKAFTLTATPKTPAQTDTQCGNLTLTETGTKGVSTGETNVKLCWK
jgi:type IV pilus assembly protein PilE